MTCSCNDKSKHINTWGCGCNEMPPEPKGTPCRKGVVKLCDVCDPCEESKSNVRLCAFVVPTLEEGRYYRNSFVFVQEDDSTYYISDDRSEIPFGSRPKFIDDFDPTSEEFKNTVVYDLKNERGYVFGPDGTYMTISLSATPVSSITAGDGIIITANEGDYTIAADMARFASASDLSTLADTVAGDTSRIDGLEDDVEGLDTDLGGLTTEVANVRGIAEDAAQDAATATSNASTALSTANAASAAVANKQDAIVAGENIIITDGKIISASVPAYGRATSSNNGLMGSADRIATRDKGFVVPSTTVAQAATTVGLSYTQSTTADDGATYTDSTITVTIPEAGNGVAGVISGADKAKVDTIPQITYTTTDPGAGGPLAANNFIVVYEA